MKKEFTQIKLPKWANSTKAQVCFCKMERGTDIIVTHPEHEPHKFNWKTKRWNKIKC